MTNQPSDVLTQKIADKLRLVQAHTLQALAEDMAVLTCPARFNERILYRQGRNADAQTTKGWPDAYVVTDINTVDGIEATRDKQTWYGHLQDDLTKAADKEYLNLSGYFFVGGYPEHEPPNKEITNWTNKFIAQGVPAKNVQLLIGKHLAMELADPKYARIRQEHLGLASSAQYFEALEQTLVPANTHGLVHLSEKDFDNGRVYKPPVMEEAIKRLHDNGCVLVRGHGACGKTTLAQSIGLDRRFSLSPVYLLDLARMSGRVAIGDLTNEMVSLSGQGVLLIIDNIHIDERTSEVLLNHWKKYCAPLGARVMLLGRETHSASGTPLGSISPIVLRAGASDLEGIVKCVLQQNAMQVSRIPRAEIRKWVVTFGGKSRQRDVAVDLLAFSAAVHRRTSQLLLQDWRLTPKDAVDAVRDRYLGPLTDDRDMANVLRLAALSEYELPVPIRALPYPNQGFARSVAQLGIVLAHEETVSLAHAALGPLLLAAAVTAKPNTERLKAACSSPALGFRMLLRNTYPHERKHLLAAMSEVIEAGLWWETCEGLHDVATVLSGHVRMLGKPAAQIDVVVSSDSRFHAVVNKSRSLETLSSFAGRMRSLQLTQIADATLNSGDMEHWEALEQNLLLARAGEVLAFLKNIKNPGMVAAKINLRRWNNARLTGSVDRASTTSQLVRYLESIGQHRLAQVPALHFLQNFDLDNLHASDLGDVSNIVRGAKATQGELSTFFTKLRESGWLDKAYLDTRSGQICGSLISFNNTLPDQVRIEILTPAIEERIQIELCKLDGTLKQDVARFVCMLGGSTALWGNRIAIGPWAWPPDLKIADVYASRGPRQDDERGLGMYELQFWCGIKWLADNGRAPMSHVDASFGDAFLDRLTKSAGPTPRARTLQAQLVEWAKDCQARTWHLTAVA
ncbi:Uncharacterised protein [Burkholderia pseudomallei]|nr:Uncharacterised protein [Burkholderia pseudomallei]